jgi:hypothetical protein
MAKGIQVSKSFDDLRVKGRITESGEPDRTKQKGAGRSGLGAASMVSAAEADLPQGTISE